MNRYKNVLLAIILLASLTTSLSFLPTKKSELKSSSSRIIEIDHFSDLLKYIKPNSLVLLDIDDTLMEAKQTMGTDRWFIWRIDYYKKNGLDPNLAKEKALMDWVSVQCLTEVRLTEEGTNQIVKRIQDEGFHTMGLTTRGGSLATRTTQQLKTIDIDLSRSAPVKEEILFLNPIEVMFKNGALFTSGTHKGKSLFIFLDLIKEKFPQNKIEEVVFINDKKSHLSEIKEICEERGVPFIGLRYGYSDERVRNFSEEIAAFQFEQFGKIISDEDAIREMNME
jgi:hypothetical protein